MAPNTAVLKPYVGSDSLRQNVPRRNKTHDKQANTACGAIWLKKKSLRHMTKKHVISGKSHDGQKNLKYGFAGVYIYICIKLFSCQCAKWMNDSQG